MVVNGRHFFIYIYTFPVSVVSRLMNILHFCGVFIQVSVVFCCKRTCKRHASSCTRQKYILFDKLDEYKNT